MNGIAIIFFISCLCFSMMQKADANQHTGADNQPKLIRMPPGCSCLDTTSSHDSVSFLSDCEMFDCSCACDLYPNRCDEDCCCDLDCSQYELLDSKCSEEEGSNGSMLAKVCFEKDAGLQTINVPYRKRIDHSIEEKIDGLICVLIDNSELKGEFFMEATNPSGPLVSQLSKRKAIDFDSYLSQQGQQNASPDNVTTKSYKIGDAIPTYWVKTIDSKPSLYNHNSGLTIPNKGDDGFCSGTNAVQFNKDVPSSSCYRIVNDLATECQQKFSIDAVITDIYVGKKRYPLVLDDLVQVSLSKLSDSNRIDVANKAMEESLETQWDNETLTCRQALSKVSYEISHDEDGSIIRVTVSINATNISSEEKTFQQEYSVSFSRADDVISTDENKRSGNPGYVFGLPTLAKISTTSPDINASKMKIMGLGDGGKCHDNTNSMIVGFGEDMMVGCTISLTRTELQDLCTSQTHPFLSKRQVASDYMYIPKWLINEVDLIGIYGNADPLQQSHWLPIVSPIDQLDFKAKSRAWLPSQSRCDGLATNLRFRILWTYSGRTNNPQAKIISATKEYDEGTPLIHRFKFSNTQEFPFTTTVTWIFIKPEHEVVKNPLPTLLTVPNDVFYPFQMSSSSILPTGWTMKVLVVFLFCLY